MSNLGYSRATIASGTTTDAIPMDGDMLVSVRCPANLTSTVMAIYTCPEEDGTYLPVYSGGADLSYVVEASKEIKVVGDKIISNWIKLVFGSTETAKTFEIVTIRL